MFKKLSLYIKDSITEMKKVTWPTRKETYNYTILVISISIGMAAYLGALDFLFTKIFEVVVNK